MIEKQFGHGNTEVNLLNMVKHISLGRKGNMAFQQNGATHILPFTIFLLFLLSFHSGAFSQPLNNEWIDFSKTYYKFKLGTTGLCRIDKNLLIAKGLGNVPAEQFQLWRNGQQVPIYTSAATGVLPSGGYIEFWGEKNDGKPDKYLYRDVTNQLSDRISLQTDTAVFFLTVNVPTVSNPNLRLTVYPNNIPTTTPAALTYFKHKLNIDFKEIINRGYAEDVSEYIYSSTYDMGEFWSSNEITANSSRLVSIGKLYPYPSGGDANVSAGFAANNTTSRVISLSFDNSGGTILLDTLYGLSANTAVNPSLPISLLTTSPGSFIIGMTTSNPNDRVVCNYITLEYPRIFDFGGTSNFRFALPASSQDIYLDIANFNYGSSPPVLYDFANQQSFVGNINVGGRVRFYLPPTATDRDLLLVAQDGSILSINYIAQLEQKKFTDFSLAANQGDFLMVTNKVLGMGPGGAAERYRAYRSQRYNAKLYDIDELVDQFAFGIKKHPLSVKNFTRFAYKNFTVRPKAILLLGKGVAYNEYTTNQSSSNADLLNLVPTWGWPASDPLMVSGSMDPEPLIGVGRVSAVSEAEVNVYLDKLIQYESNTNSPNNIADKAWMKQIVHVSGANDPGEDALFTSYLNQYEATIKQPFFGAKVDRFNKTTTGPVTSIYNQQFVDLFATGIGLVTYYGHGSSKLLNYANLNDPYAFANNRKYPFFLVNGCSVGEFYDYDISRFGLASSIAEKYVFAPQKGAIGFIGSTHFGLTDKLNIYTTGFYSSLAGANGYQQPISKNMTDAIAALKSASGNGFDNHTIRLHAEQTVLCGDPVAMIYASAKPDFAIEQPQVSINPTIISITDASFKLKVNMYNLGKATNDSMGLTIKRKYPNGKTEFLFNGKYKPVFYMETFELTIPINRKTDKGLNLITVSLDPDKSIDEISETNNTAEKQFSIVDNGIDPVFPYQFAILNNANFKLVANTSNPVSAPRNILMDIDTTLNFNSPLKVSRTINSMGGAISFDPTITLLDGTVYYWRVAPQPASGNPIYSNSSFLYLKNAPSNGFAQAHYYQHLSDSMQGIYIDSTDRKWKFLPDSNNFIIRQAIFPTSGTEDASFATVVNGVTVARSACVGHSIIFNLFDPVNLKALYNQPNPSVIQNGTIGGFMGSAPTCNVGRDFNFEFSLLDTAGRRSARDFINWVPTGYILTARLNYDNPTPTSDVWKADEVYFGTGNTLYHKLKNIGFNEVDSFNAPRTFVFICKKNTPSFPPKWKISKGLYDAVSLDMNIAASDTLGYITSPRFGPVATWKKLIWSGNPLEVQPGDQANISLIGIDTFGKETVLMDIAETNKNVDISSINAKLYPYLKLSLRNSDSINLTAYQLNYWRLLADFLPEGSLAGNVAYQFKDTFYAGEDIHFAIAFKNIGGIPFGDSLFAKLEIVDNNNVTTSFPQKKWRKLADGDTIIAVADFKANDFLGANVLYIDFNPDNLQPEYTHSNNFTYKSFYVVPDDKNPLIDVTFDGVHILSNDIVSSKPDIKITLRDEAKYLLLNDTSLVTVKLTYPNLQQKKFSFDGDTLRFTPATSGGKNNLATIDFLPYLPEDGNYQLTVTGKDMAGNKAGSAAFKVNFQVINKPMISNMFNYPNPFTTSTAFVFTVTGSEVPQNIKIQILTVTGKVVREITKEELGNIHIGNNITSFKWDGTDAYGSPLGNGVYLYRVVARLNGGAIEKFTLGSDKQGGDPTDVYFRGGYGKMYLMR